MPLVVFCGIPSSGKTTRALELKKYLEEKYQSNVILINEEGLGLIKKDAYKGQLQEEMINDLFKDYTAEKMTRAYLKSNVEKTLSKQNVIILDSQNYIKGNKAYLRV